MSVHFGSRIDSIDALRAVAVTCVLIDHLVSAGSSGTFGVCLFFVVSGFVIPGSLVSDRRWTLLRFGIARFFRLYPVYWITLAAALAFGGISPGSITWERVLTSILMVPRLFGQAYFQGVYWTLEVELLFYVFMACAFAAGLLSNPSRVERLIVAMGSALLIAGSLNAWAGMALRVQPLAYLFLMLSGSWLRVRPEASWTRSTLWMVGMMTILVAFHVTNYVIAPINYPENYDPVEHPPESIEHLFTAIYFLLEPRNLSGVLMPPFVLLVVLRTMEYPPAWLSALGRISYSVYLLHVPVAYLVYVSIREVVPSVVERAIGIASIILVSAATYRWIERPTIALGGRIHARLSADHRRQA